jgi:transglutaminase-like putative cysteine protease
MRLPGSERVRAMWLAASVAVTLAPHVTGLPTWLSGFAALMLLWLCWIVLHGLRLPSRWLLLVAVGGAVAGVLLTFRTPLGKDPGVALLTAFLALKLLEARAPRDGYVVVLLCYFMQLAQFFANQSIATAGLTLLGTVVTTATLTTLNSERLGTRERLRLSGLMLAQAVPFMLVLFVLFPRVDKPLWGLPSDAFGGSTGLSDSMTPGSISDLTLSGAIAFRVRFDGFTPAAAQRYWRGPVMNDFDGRTWRVASARMLAKVPYPVSGPRTAYELTLEAHNRPWLFALEMPGGAPDNAMLMSDYQLVSRTPVRNRLRYLLSAHTAVRPGRSEDATILEAALQLPPDFNPRTRELARSLRAENPDGAALIAAALRHFSRSKFTYTLSPPLLGRDSVDEFLFDTRRGFCEHFASSFVFLMRAAGLPARVVTGYQGGEINPVDDYLEVRQSDAHAWAEVWVANQGWLRVDPTATVAPSRVQGGLAMAVPEGEPLPLALRPAFSWVREVRYRLDAVNNSWNQWVLGYNPQRQKELLERLGMQSPDWHTMTIAMSVLCGLLMLALAGWALAQRGRLDPLQRAWERLSQKLAPAGLARKAWEGPLDYAERVGLARPELAAAVREIARDYCGLRYGAGQPAAPDKAARQLVSMINRLHP